MNQNRMRIWQRGDARQIMREARAEFRRSTELPSAHVALASVHYSLIKRYRHGAAWVVALWHLLRATYHVNAAFNIMGLKFTWFNPDQLDIMSSVWVATPVWFGGGLRRAEMAIEHALYAYGPDMKPHTRALLFIRYGEIKMRFGQLADAYHQYKSAEGLIDAIKLEDSNDREQQLVRVEKAIALFYLDHGVEEKMRLRGLELLSAAAQLAKTVSRDQFLAILDEVKKRGLTLHINISE